MPCAEPESTVASFNTHYAIGGDRRFDPMRIARTVTAFDADLEIAGRAVRVISVHLGLDPRERRIQASRLFEATRARPAGPCMLLGDFNDWRAGSRDLREFRAILPDGLSLRS